MKLSSKVLETAVEAFSKLPGIGRKTALRTVLYLAQSNKDLARLIAEALTALVRDIQTCQKCYNLSDDELCMICSDRARDKSKICVVSGVRDVMAIEETGQFRGLYHVLGGVISPIDGIGPEKLNIDSLIARIDSDQVNEVIMAINPTIEGETTIYYLSKLLTAKEVSVTVLARGISFGGELEYADELTLGKSILTRMPYRTAGE